MDKKAIAWLYDQLPELVDKGIISAESAERLKKHYGSVKATTGTRTFLLVFGVIGALLVGLGIILILAHNWEQLTKLNRLMISVGLLVVAQTAAGSVLWFKADSQAWRETTATLLMLMVGAAMALVGQTYHLAENADTFLRTWMLLALPLMYLMNSVSVAVLYTIGVTVWAAGGYADISNQWIWVLFGLVLPYYRNLLQNNRYANATVILSWVLTICFYFCFAAAFSQNLASLGMLIYSCLFVLTYLCGVLWFSSREGWMPFRPVGLAGSIFLTFFLTFHDIWSHLQVSRDAGSGVLYLFVAVLLALVIGGMLRVRNNPGVRQFALIPCVIGAGYLIQYFDGSGIGATLILNAYMLGLSISVIAAGVKEYNLAKLNLGMFMVAALIIARFFDMDVSFVVRGVLFVLAGIGFLVANVVIVRRKAGGQHEK